MYRKEYNKPWTFNKSGISFLNEKSIIVLEEGRELKDPMPHIITDRSIVLNMVYPKSVAFDQWFAYVDPMQSTIISRFSISTTAAGDTLLMDNNLSSMFPAALKEPDPGNMYYFSGDFTHADIPYWTSRFVGIEKLKGIFIREITRMTQGGSSGFITDHYSGLS